MTERSLLYDEESPVSMTPLPTPERLSQRANFSLLQFRLLTNKVESNHYCLDPKTTKWQAVVGDSEAEIGQFWPMAQAALLREHQLQSNKLKALETGIYGGIQTTFKKSPTWPTMDAQLPAFQRGTTDTHIF